MPEPHHNCSSGPPNRNRSLMQVLQRRSLQQHDQEELPSQTPVFPSEIFEQIIEYLDRDTETLTNCVLVSRNWLPRSRHLRLRAAKTLSVHMNAEKDLSHFLRFLQFSSPSSLIGIQNLTLNAPVQKHPHQRLRLCPHVVGFIMSHLPQLRILKVSHVQFGHRTTTYSPNSRSPERNSMYAPVDICRKKFTSPAPFELAHVQLDHVGSGLNDLTDLIHFFNLFSKVQHINAKNIYIGRRFTHLRGLSSSRVLKKLAKKSPELSDLRTQTLVAYSCPSLLQILQTNSSPPSQTLESLKGSCDTFQEISSLNKYLTKFGQHVSRLELGLPIAFSLDEVAQSQLIDLSSCPQLQHLSLSINFHQLKQRLTNFSMKYTALCESILRFLTLIPDTLTKLTFDITIQSVDEAECLSKCMNWKRLDDMLIEVPSLRNVCIRYRVSVSRLEMPIERCLSGVYIRNHAEWHWLPRLQRRRKLAVDTTCPLTDIHNHLDGRILQDLNYVPPLTGQRIHPEHLRLYS